MNIDKKTCINIGIVTFLLYLAIHYWDGLVGLFNLFLAAAGTLINGAIIAYVLNILMRFYERHMAPTTKKKVWNAMRRPVCMALAFLTLVAVIVALIQIILPQLISCVQVLLSSLPGVLRQMYDKLMENPTIAALMVDYNLVLPATEQEWREIIERAANLLFNGAGNVVNTAVSFTTSLVGSILSLLMSLIFTFNILIGKETLQRQSRNLLHRVLGDTRMARAMHIISTLDDCFHNYIVGQCTEAVILGTLCTIGMTLLRLDYALMLGTFVGMMALIPIIGPYIGAAVGCIMLFSISPAKSLEFLISLFLLQQVQKGHPVSGAADQVDAQGLCLVSVGLDIAAAGGHHGAGTAPPGPADHLAGFFVADGGNGTGIDDVSVGTVLKVHQLVAPAAQLLLHGLGLVLVHLAAQRVNGSSHGDSPCTFRVNSV